MFKEMMRWPIPRPYSGQNLITKAAMLVDDRREQWHGLD
jgi:hypothetical protein